MQQGRIVLELQVKVQNFAIVNNENGRVKTKEHAMQGRSL